MELAVYQKVHELQLDGWWWGYGRNKIVADLLLKFAGTLHNRKLLDVGCSEGAFLSFIAKYGVDLRAIDSEEIAIQYCHERGFGDRVQRGDIRNLSCQNNSFDLVTALDVVEHVEEDQEAISELVRVCKEGGTLVLMVPAHPWLWSSNDTASHHVRRYSKNAFMRLFEQTNVKIEFMSYFNMFLLPVFVAVTFWKKLFPSDGTSNVMVRVPRLVNWMLSRTFDLESLLMSKFNMRLPFGSSLVFLIRKTGK